MLVGDMVTLVTEQFTDGCGPDAITIRDGRPIVRTHWDETIAEILAIYENGGCAVEFDDGQIWTLDKIGEIVGRYFENGTIDG